MVGLQEFREKFRGATIKNALPGWAWSNQNTSVPITWNAAKFDLVAKDRVQEFGVTRVAGGPVGRSAGPKFAEWVQLRDRRTGATFVMVNHHLLYNIESKGRPDKRVGKQLPQPGAEADAGRAASSSTASPPSSLPVVVTKDGNWDYRKSARTKHPASPYVQAARHGLYTNWQVLGSPKQGTQSSGTRLIDSVSATTALLIPVQQTILGTPRKRFRGSDHRPPVVALTNTGSSIEASLTKAAHETAHRHAGSAAGERRQGRGPDRGPDAGRAGHLHHHPAGREGGRLVGRRHRPRVPDRRLHRAEGIHARRQSPLEETGRQRRRRHLRPTDQAGLVRHHRPGQRPRLRHPHLPARQEDHRRRRGRRPNGPAANPPARPATPSPD